MKSFKYLLIAILFSTPTFALPGDYRATQTAANTLSILAGLGLFGAAVIDTVGASQNATGLNEPFAHVSSSALLLFASGSVLSILASEMNAPTLLERTDEFATGMTGVGSVLIAGGIWGENVPAIKTGAIVLTSFFVAKAHLVPLILQKNAAHLRTSDRVLIITLTALGNTGGALLLWATFEVVRETSRHVLQAGMFVLGVTIPVTLTALTANLWRQGKARVSTSQ